MKNILLLLGTVLVGGVLLEGAIRLFVPQPTPGLPHEMVSMIDATWRLTPGYAGIMDNTVDFRGKRFRTDSNGYRYTPAASDVTAPKHRLFLLGDSQTFGHGLDETETWAQQLQQRLNEAGYTIRVENLGIPGINIDQYVAKVKTMVLPEAQPGDAVLVGMSWNDLTTPQTAVYVQNIIRDDKPTIPEPRDTPTKPVAETDGGIQGNLKTYDDRAMNVVPFATFKQLAAWLRDRSALGALAYRAAQGVYYGSRNDNPILQRLQGGVPEANFALLKYMKDTLEAADLRFAVVFFHNRVTIDDALFASFSQDGRFFSEQDVMGRYAAPLCRETGITCLNPFDAMRNAHMKQPIFYKVDGHYNEFGAAVIANFVFDHLGALFER